MSGITLACLRTALAQGSRAQVIRSLSVSAIANKDYTMNDPIEHATGIEKFELMAKAKGNDDPFFLMARKRGKGTKENPNIVDAMDSYRMVGCVCNEEDTNIKWFWIFENKPKRCECGYWFKLERHEAPDRFKLPV